MAEKVAFWFRRDLRLDDNVGLAKALKSGHEVVPVFIFDREILDELPAQDARVDFIHRTIWDLQHSLGELGSSMVVKYGQPLEIWPQLLVEHKLSCVYTNHDYEPYALQRDGKLREMLAEKGVGFETFRDQVIFEREEIVSKAKGTAYTVFTPYSKAWKAALTKDRLADVKTEAHFGQFWSSPALPIPSLKEMGFQETDTWFPERIPDKEIIKLYDQTRNFPSLNGTSRTGLHLRFGTLSIRKLVRVAKALNETYLNELIWREFYMQILANFPHVVNGPFRTQYAAIKWRENKEELALWKAGKTGYPMVDAGMREIAATGHMHNRSRMVVASFLTKHLLINWQEGERYFAEKLLDFELSSNNGGWQWAAGSGTDAAPYFRIFNPESQFKKFDPKGAYVRKWVPEYGTPAYPKPIVDHKMARDRCLSAYKLALGRE
ncbi:MAG: deoxyribodipyrimidine photo-lyase [Bacteroidota bacterium]